MINYHHPEYPVPIANYHRPDFNPYARPPYQYDDRSSYGPNDRPNYYYGGWPNYFPPEIPQNYRNWDGRQEIPSSYHTQYDPRKYYDHMTHMAYVAHMARFDPSASISNVNDKSNMKAQEFVPKQTDPPCDISRSAPKQTNSSSDISDGDIGINDDDNDDDVVIEHSNSESKSLELHSNNFDSNVPESSEKCESDTEIVEKSTTVSCGKSKLPDNPKPPKIISYNSMAQDRALVEKIKKADPFEKYNHLQPRRADDPEFPRYLNNIDFNLFDMLLPHMEDDEIYDKFMPFLSTDSKNKHSWIFELTKYGIWGEDTFPVRVIKSKHNTQPDIRVYVCGHKTYHEDPKGKKIDAILCDMLVNLVMKCTTYRCEQINNTLEYNAFSRANDSTELSQAQKNSLEEQIVNNNNRQLEMLRPASVKGKKIKGSLMDLMAEFRQIHVHESHFDEIFETFNCVRVIDDQ
jgi:hypothetical protein